MGCPRRIHFQWLVGLLAAIYIQSQVGKLGDLHFLTSHILCIIMMVVYGCQTECFWGPDIGFSLGDVLPRGDVQMSITSMEDTDQDDNCNVELVSLAADRPPPSSRITSVKSRTDSRHFFLDHIKILLTFWVVTFHVACSFGACSGLWMVAVGSYPNASREGLLKPFVLLSQAFFMPLFFFISGFNTPSSFRRKGKIDFVRDKARRLLLPAPGHAWYIFFLLLFTWAYVTLLQQPITGDDGARITTPFPGWGYRLAYGSLVCGFGTLAAIVLTRDSVFWGMPLVHGSLGCDILMFTAGVYAKENNWLEPSLSLRRPMLLFMLVSIESLAVMWMGSLVVDDDKEASLSTILLFFLAAGMMCVDISMAILYLFQKYANFKPYRILVEASYTVYIIHPLVVASTTVGFVHFYNAQYGHEDHDIIQFKHHHDPSPVFAISSSHLKGPGEGSLHVFIGFTIVTILSHCVCWPLAWCLCHLPGLRHWLL